MAGIEYKIFRVEKLENIPYEFYPLDDSPLHEIDWNVTNSVDATMMLYKTCENERRQLVNISRLCSVPDEFINLDDEKYYLMNLDYRLSTENMRIISKLGRHSLDMETWCSRLKNQITAYRDVYYRDISAFEQVNSNINIYAVVLLYQGHYQGHVYVWRRPTEKNYLMVIGIRNRIDTIWHRDDSSLRNIALYLFEGVRLFANYLEIKYITVVEPFNIMIQILSKIGYVRAFIPARIIGTGIVEVPPGQSSTCYYSASFNQPYIEGTFNVTIIDE